MHMRTQKRRNHSYGLTASVHRARPIREHAMAVWCVAILDFVGTVFPLLRCQEHSEKIQEIIKVQ